MDDTFLEDLTIEQIHERAYRQGLEAGIRRYAWWKSGVQYVGSGLCTLKEALADIEREFGGADAARPGGDGETT